MSVEAKDIDLAQHKTGSTSSDAYNSTAISAVVELVTDVSDLIDTVTVMPALTLVFTFMTHPPYRVIMFILMIMVCVKMRPRYLGLL